jgi:hypothetical protein
MSKGDPSGLINPVWINVAAAFQMLMHKAAAAPRIVVTTIRLYLPLHPRHMIKKNE